VRNIYYHQIFKFFLGSQKSNLISVVRRALRTLETLFPSVFVTEKHDIDTETNTESRDYHLLVQNDTELGLTKTLAARVRYYFFLLRLNYFIRKKISIQAE
jgi:hypothetical protein